MTDVPEGFDLRVGRPRTSDADLMAGFSCTRTASAFEAEVEDHIRLGLHSWACAEVGADRRLLLLFDIASGQLAAVGAHERGIFYERDSNESGRMVYVVAVATNYQGTTAPDGRRFGEVILDATIDDIVNRQPPDPVVSAVIHRDNASSLNLFRRRGFDQRASWNGDYLIVW